MKFLEIDAWFCNNYFWIVFVFFKIRFKDIATCHEILGVKVDSTKEQIKEAFFEKSKQVQLSLLGGLIRLIVFFSRCDLNYISLIFYLFNCKRVFFFNFPKFSSSSISLKKKKKKYNHFVCHRVNRCMTVSQYVGSQ